MTAEVFISRLEKVKQTKPDSWVACCPAHPDKNPSLAVRELDDGRVLIYCRAGCATRDIIAAVGLEFSDLYPPKLTDTFIKSERKPFNAADILKIIALEVTVVEIAANMMLADGKLKENDFERLQTASERINAALTASVVRRNG